MKTAVVRTQAARISAYAVSSPGTLTARLCVSGLTPKFAFSLTSTSNRMQGSCVRTKTLRKTLRKLKISTADKVMDVPRVGPAA